MRPPDNDVSMSAQASNNLAADEIPHKDGSLGPGRDQEQLVARVAHAQDLCRVSLEGLHELAVSSVPELRAQCVLNIKENLAKNIENTLIRESDPAVAMRTSDGENTKSLMVPLCPNSNPCKRQRI